MENQEPQPIVPNTPVAPVTPPVQNPIVSNPVIPSVTSPATAPVTNTPLPEHKNNNIITALLVVILILGSLGAFYFYNKSVAPVVPEVPVVENTDMTTQGDEQEEITNTSDWKTTKVYGTGGYDYGFSVIYPPTWSVVIPGENECVSIMCSASFAMSGGMATQLVPPGVLAEEAVAFKIYIGANSEAGDSVCDPGDIGEVYSYCYKIKEGIILWTELGAKKYIVDTAKIIVSDYERKNKISTTLPQHIRAQVNWPPVIKSSTKVYACTPTAQHGESYSPSVEQKTINGKIYCVSYTIEGAAGSRYGEYTYIRENGTGTKTTNFTLKWPSCDNFDNPERDQCKTEQTTFFNNLNTLIDSLMQ